MSIKDRINRLTGDTERLVQADSKKETINELRKKIEEVMNRRERFALSGVLQHKTAVMPLEHVITGEEVSTVKGRIFVSRCTLKSEDFHGNMRVADLACCPMDAASFFSGLTEIKGMSIEDGLFLDTETTGLAGGTGTFPFLIGLGWFEAGSFITCQIFCRDFSEEPAQLTMLAEIASEKRFLVTFNGRSFDVGLLGTRFILNRVPDVLTTMPHIDLLHPSRKIFSHRLENSRLVTLEANVLGIERHDDVPGFEIPQRYFEWLRRRDPYLMEDVFRHNRLDVISMASLLKRISELVLAKDIGQAHQGDILCAAKINLDRGDFAAAERMLGSIMSSELPEVALQAKRHLSRIHKKQGRWEEAVNLWKEMNLQYPFDLFSVQELAKFYEHHTYEFDLAMNIIQKVLDKEHGLNADDRHSLEHRMKRLVKKKD